MKRLPVRTSLALMLLVATLAPTAGQAGTGSASSGPAAIDTRLPVVAVDNVPPNTVLQVGKTITFAWVVGDDNPSSGGSDNMAEMWLGDLLFENHSFSPGSGSHTWQWTVPDTTSGTAHLIVRSADTFGNTSSASTNNFTILSATTSVPQAGGRPVFAPPTPNPFNPLTELRFNLPSAGLIQLTVHDARGYLIRTLLQTYQPAGPLVSSWDGTDTAGRRQAGGTYFFRLVYSAQGHSAQAVHKAVLLP
jgi:hypothetical protein